MPKYVEYEHHGVSVMVREDLKGRHREFCLCYSCKYFHPGEDDNCPTAHRVFRTCVNEGVVTPVWECPLFEEKKS